MSSKALARASDARAADAHDRLYSALPDALSCVGVGGASAGGSARAAVEELLAATLPPSDAKEIGGALKKTFALTTPARAKKIRKAPPRKSAKYLTARERKALGLGRLPRRGKMLYADFSALHSLWQGYMRELLALENYRGVGGGGGGGGGAEDPLQIKLCRADYHGAIVQVTKASCQAMIGLQGLMIMETRNTFQLVTKQDRVKIVPKTGTSFSFELDGFLFTVCGSVLVCKPAERAVKKWKKHPPPFDF